MARGIVTCQRGSRPARASPSDPRRAFRPSFHDLIDALAATHAVQLGLHGDHGTLCLEHRLAVAPDDDCLADLVSAARATYALLHGGEAPEETNVAIEPLGAEERDAEVRTTERRMAPARTHEPLSAAELGLDDPDIDFGAD